MTINSFDFHFKQIKEVINDENRTVSKSLRSRNNQIKKNPI